MCLVFWEFIRLKRAAFWSWTCVIVRTKLQCATSVRLSVNYVPFLCVDVAHMRRRGIPLLWQLSTGLCCTWRSEGNTQAGLWNKSQRHSHHQLCHSGDCTGNPAGIKWKRTQTNSHMHTHTFAHAHTACPDEPISPPLFRTKGDNFQHMHKCVAHIAVHTVPLFDLFYYSSFTFIEGSFFSFTQPCMNALGVFLWLSSYFIHFE